MKIDGLTGGAIAFAAFAAWYVLKKPAGKRTTGSPAADLVYNNMTSQRHEVGNALISNLDYLGGGYGLVPSTVRPGGGSYGLQAPNSGFWAI